MSEEKKVGFTSYELNGIRIIPTPEQERLFENKMYSLNCMNITYRPPPPDTRSRLQKIYDDYRKRLSHAWYALKGYDCD